MVYGGAKYARELRRLSRYMRLMGELSRKGRLVEVCGARVDAVAREVRDEVCDAGFNDEHLVAIVVVSGCRVVCTNDKGAIPFLKRQALYSKRQRRRPKIYTSERHRGLCCGRLVTAACK